MIKFYNIGKVVFKQDTDELICVAETPALAEEISKAMTDLYFHKEVWE